MRSGLLLPDPLKPCEFSLALFPLPPSFPASSCVFAASTFTLAFARSFPAVPSVPGVAALHPSEQVSRLHHPPGQCNSSAESGRASPPGCTPSPWSPPAGPGGFSGLRLTWLGIASRDDDVTGARRWKVAMGLATGTWRSRTAEIAGLVTGNHGPAGWTRADDGPVTIAGLEGG